MTNHCCSYINAMQSALSNNLWELLKWKFPQAGPEFVHMCVSSVRMHFASNAQEIRVYCLVRCCLMPCIYLRTQGLLIHLLPH